jgi:hypothetical protein
VVWIDMLPSDGDEAARRAARILDDPRVTHFRDPERHAGRAFAGALGAPGLVAWDVYLLFDAQAAWSDPAPAPRDWLHQLGDARADPARRRRGAGLAESLHGSAGAMGWPVPPAAPDRARWSATQAAALGRLGAAE